MIPAYQCGNAVPYGRESVTVSCILRSGVLNAPAESDIVLHDGYGFLLFTHKIGRLLDFVDCLSGQHAYSVLGQETNVIQLPIRLV